MRERKTASVSEEFGPKKPMQLHAEKPEQAKLKDWAPSGGSVTSRELQRDGHVPLLHMNMGWTYLGLSLIKFGRLSAKRYSPELLRDLSDLDVCFKNTWGSCAVKGKCPVVNKNKTKDTLPNLKTKKLWGGRGSEKGSLRNQWWLGGWAPACLWERGRAHMEHEKKGVGEGEKVRRRRREEGEGRKRRRRRWWTDGRGSEVDAGQLAAGGLRELGHHAGQGPVLSLQPLLNLPQGLNLLYLGEVLQEGRWGGGERGE